MKEADMTYERATRGILVIKSVLYFTLLMSISWLRYYELVTIGENWVKSARSLSVLFFTTAYEPTIISK